MEHRRDRQWMAWGGMLAAAVLFAAAAAKFAYFPGDVAITRFAQSLFGDHIGWAQTVTNTVRAPWNLALAAITAALAWWIAGKNRGWRAALLAVVSFVGVWLAEPYLKALIARPRPSPSLVNVAGSPTGYGFPSGFALIYFSTIGYLGVLALHRLSGNARWRVALVCGLILLIGGAARVVPGAHWPSDVIGAYLICLAWTTLLARFA
ncbi:MAG: phosphatase PAP2 family protein [Blastocatellia bacterium]